jgi:hypothetical protein
VAAAHAVLAVVRAVTVLLVSFLVLPGVVGTLVGDRLYDSLDGDDE